MSSNTEVESLNNFRSYKILVEVYASGSYLSLELLSSKKNFKKLQFPFILRRKNCLECNIFRYLMRTNAFTLSFSTDDEPINIIFHVPSTCERQDYDQPGNMMLLTCYIQFDVFLTVHHSIDFFKLPT